MEIRPRSTASARWRAQSSFGSSTSSPALKASAADSVASCETELPKDDCARHLAEAVERGLISMAKVDEIVGRVLTEKFRLGLFENPYAPSPALKASAADSVASCETP